MADNLEIRQMEARDVKDAVDCFTSFGLEESLSTAQAFYECDPKAFFVAIDKKQNRLIGTCGAPIIGHDSGFLGLYAVQKQFQNQGIGKLLFKKCMDYIGERNCGLHAVPDKLPMYRDRSGFKVIEGVQMLDFHGVPHNWSKLLKTINDKTKIEELNAQNEELISLIIRYDNKVHLQSREQLMRSTITKPDYKTFVAIDTQSAQLIGFGCIRPNNGGEGMIGPVYADNETVAEVLIRNLIQSSIVSQTRGLLYMTVSESFGGIRIAQKLQIEESFRCERLFTKHTVPVDYRYIYCLHSPNFAL